MIKEQTKDYSDVISSHMRTKSSINSIYNPILASYGKYLPNYQPQKNQIKLKDQFDFSLLNKLSSLSSTGRMIATSKNIPNHFSKKKSNTTISNLTTTANTTTLSSASSLMFSPSLLTRNQKIYTSTTGLNNLGNICYMNTALQILIHCPIFISQLNALTITSSKVITMNLFNMCVNMSKSGKAYSPIEIKKTFAEKHSEYIGYNQHDSMEFCRILLDDISRENNLISTEEAKKVKYEELSTKNKNKYEISKQYDMLYRRKENSFIISLFYPQIVNTFTCKCGYISYSFEKLIDIPLLLNEEKETSLESLIDNYFTEENFKWESKCDNCKQKEIHNKSTRIINLPNVLIFSLQRINERLHIKNNSVVSFKEEINIKKYCDDSISYKESGYSLFGISNHCGSIDFGHYFANCKINGQWYEFNDSNVRAESSIKLNSSSVYCLFYINNNQ